MSEPRHTPTPWAIAPHPDDAELVEIVADYSELPGGRKVAHWIAECDAGCDDGDHAEAIATNIANAQFIVQAVNAHDALLAALREYGQHKTLCPLATTYRRARAYHVDHHNGYEDWPGDTGSPECGDPDCVAWAGVGCDGAPDCTCGFVAALALVEKADGDQ